MCNSPEFALSLGRSCFNLGFSTKFHLDFSKEKTVGEGLGSLLIRWLRGCFEISLIDATHFKQVQKGLKKKLFTVD